MGLPSVQYFTPAQKITSALPITTIPPADRATLPPQKGTGNTTPITRYTVDHGSCPERKVLLGRPFSTPMCISFPGSMGMFPILVVASAGW